MEQKLTVANKVAYGMSDFGNNLVFVAATNYLMFYYTDVASISLAATGILFLVVRIFDAFAGPIFGILVDKTQTRFGKVRPWFLWMDGRAIRCVSRVAVLHCVFPSQCAVAVSVCHVCYFHHLLCWFRHGD